MKPMLFADRIMEAQCKKGYYITYSKGKRGQAPFAYTIGLNNLELPELFLSGLGRKHSLSLLDNMVVHILCGNKILPGVAYDQFFQDIKCAFGFVHKNFYPHYFGKALRYYYGDEDFQVLQCIWPNAVFHPGMTEIFPQDILISEMPRRLALE